MNRIRGYLYILLAAMIYSTTEVALKGLGGYQKQIGPFYGVVPNATGPAEPDIQNLYLVLGATCGLPGCSRNCGLRTPWTPSWRWRTPDSGRPCR